MDDSPQDVDERDRRGTSEPLDYEVASGDDFYRGGGGVAVRTGHRQPHWWPGGLDAGRPPVWLSLSLAIVGVLVGFVAFSAAWDLAGDGLLAVPLATLAGVAVAVGTILLGGYAWTRTATRPHGLPRRR